MPNRYVATKLGRRRDEIELWLSRGENAVARFVRRLENDKLVSLDFEEATALLYGLVGLGFRSAHVIQAWCAALRHRATQDASGLHPETEDEITRLALENLVNLVSVRVQAVTPPYFEIVRTLWSDVVLADQVALIAPGSAGELYIPLSPRTVVCIRRSVGRSEFEIVDADRKHSPNLIETLNDLLIKGARRWVVATTNNQLDDRAADLSKSAVQRRVDENESVGVTPLPDGAGWWGLR